MSETEVSAEILASFWGVTPKTVWELARLGKIPKGSKRGSYPLRLCTQAYMAGLREAAAGRAAKDEGALDLVSERAALARAQRLKIERDAELQSKEWMRVEDVRRDTGKIAAAVLTQMQRIPDRVADTVTAAARAGDAFAVAELLRREVDDTIRDIRATFGYTTEERTT